MSNRNLKGILNFLLNEQVPEPPGNFTTSTVRGVYSGAPGFGGGPYGHGGTKQLAGGLNPATKAIADQEQDELDQNIEDQIWSLGKYVVGSGPVSKMDYKSTTSLPIPLEEVAPMDTASSRMMDLPGFPRMNSLIIPKQHTPQDVADDEYLGPTINGTPINDENVEGVLREYIQEVINELLTWRLPNPGRRGWNNTTINSLAIRRNHMEPEKPPLQTYRSMFHEPSDHYPELRKNQGRQVIKSPGFSFGAIGAPKNFVPPDWEQTQMQDDDDLDNILGQKRLQSPSSVATPRVGTNTSVREAISTNPKKKS